MIEAILFDISGVLYQDSDPIPGAVETVNRLVREKQAMRFVTNTSRKTSRQVFDDLREMGFEVSRAQIFTAPQAAVQMLREQQLRPMCLIHPALEEEFEEFSRREPNAVFLGDAGHRFDYIHLNQAFQVLLEGGPLIAVGENRYFNSHGQLFLDVGPFVKALEYAIDRPAIIVGKPAPAFFKQALASIGCKPEAALMIGDDVGSDVVGAVEAGLKGCLVRTGKYRPGDEERLPEGALLADSVVEAIEQARSRF